MIGQVTCVNKEQSCTCFIGQFMYNIWNTNSSESCCTRHFSQQIYVCLPEVHTKYRNQRSSEDWKRKYCWMWVQWPWLRIWWIMILEQAEQSEILLVISFCIQQNYYYIEVARCFISN